MTCGRVSLLKNYFRKKALLEYNSESCDDYTAYFSRRILIDAVQPESLRLAPLPEGIENLYHSKSTEIGLLIEGSRSLLLSFETPTSQFGIQVT